MPICPKCDYQFKEPLLLAFDSYDNWSECVKIRMPNAQLFKVSGKTSIQANGTVLAEWSEDQKYGFVKERRHNHLKRLTYKNMWRTA